MAEENKSEPLLHRDFHLDQIVFELRFVWGNNSFLNFRPFFLEFQESLSEPLRVIENDEPIILHYKNRIEITIASDKFSIAELKPNPEIQEFLKVAKILYEMSRKFSEIIEITRAGFRVFYAKSYDNPKQVVEALYNSGYINFPNNLHLAKSGKPILPVYGVGWQDEEKGISYRLRGRAEKVGVNLPLRLLVEKDIPQNAEKQYNQVILDMDVFVHKAVLPGQFFINDWIEQANKTAKEELKKFFGDKDVAN